MPKTKPKPFSNFVKDLTSRTFNRLTVLKFSHLKNERAFWFCSCRCGGTATISSNNLLKGGTKSCGCRNREVKRKHGHSFVGAISCEYTCWVHLKQRCENPRCASYPRYGGRGISICERWRNSFPNFLVDLGPKPSPRHSLDRKNVNGNYCPQNCRWSDPKQQARNRRTNRIIEFQGERLCVVEWAERLGAKSQALLARLRRGWSIAKTLTAPIQVRRRKEKKK